MTPGIKRIPIHEHSIGINVITELICLLESVAGSALHRTGFMLVVLLDTTSELTRPVTSQLKHVVKHNV